MLVVLLKVNSEEILKHRFLPRQLFKMRIISTDIQNRQVKIDVEQYYYVQNKFAKNRLNLTSSKNLRIFIGISYFLSGVIWQLSWVSSTFITDVEFIVRQNKSMWPWPTDMISFTLLKSFSSTNYWLLLGDDLLFCFSNQQFSLPHLCTLAQYYFKMCQVYEKTIIQRA